MTALLASIASLDEIEPALAGGADILDLKDPGAGALGAWPLAEIEKAAARLSGLRLASATVGDLPMEPETLASAAASVWAAGADIVKIGVFPGARRACIARLASLAAQGAALVAVFFADRDPDLSLLPDLGRAGFFGVMLDTADKSAGSLRRLADADTLAQFAAAARAQGLRTGFAGSLAAADIAPLLSLDPDFLGFRRALCGGPARTAPLSATAVKTVRAAMDAAMGAVQGLARSATATAGAQNPAA